MPIKRTILHEVKTFYVVFQSSVYHRPWRVWTWNGYHHAWVFFSKYKGPTGLLTPQHTLKINPLSNFITVDYWEESPEIIARHLLKKHDIKDIVKISLPIRANSSYTIRGLITCVTVVKAVLCLNRLFILTPQQLHRYLLRIGGTSLRGKNKNEFRNRFLFQTKRS